MKKLIKKLFKLYDKQDFENAIANIGDASNRDYFVWKLKIKLFGSVK